MKKRIWELDAFRGLCILGMVIVHAVYDLAILYKVVDWRIPDWFFFIQRWGNIFFLLLSGVCVTLGRHHVKRGLIVLGGGMLCTLVTVGMWKLGFFAKGMCIWFGVLHCLGVCMLLWALFRRLPGWLLWVLGGLMIAVGFYFMYAEFPGSVWLMPLGLPQVGFESSDYFPLLPNLGYFLVGAALGRVLYKNKESLLPKVNPESFPVKFLLFFGKHSLIIYLLHQPLLSGLCMLLGG